MSVTSSAVTRAVLCGLVGVAASVAPLSAQLIGTNSSPNCIPFSCNFNDPGGTVYQQVYASTNWGSPVTITGINFFLDPNYPGTLRSGTYDFYLSTTSAAVDALSTSDFNGNRGADNALFGSFVLGGAAPSTLTFLGTGFFYDPSLGNLLLDIRVTSGAGASSGGAYYQAYAGDAGGLFSRSHDFGSQFEGWGLVTEFTSDPTSTVPEPATMTLLATGLVGLGATRRKKRNG